MSYWTYINAVIDVAVDDPCQHDPQFLKEMMEIAPKITGSEGNAEVFMIPLEACSTTNTECDLCPFRKTIRWHGRGTFSCGRPEGYKCKEVHLSCKYVIVVHAQLRDRFLEQTIREFNEFTHWISTKYGGLNWSINNVACSFDGVYSWEYYHEHPRGSFKALSSGFKDSTKGLYGQFSLD